MKQADLKQILAAHKEWLSGGIRGTRANLSYANLSYADLRSADLSYANLSSADLRYADLSYADLSYADLSYANLRYANLRSANLRSANLSSADLRSADLRSADLSYANLSYADLRSADLSYANLSSANLRYADLRSANLSSAENFDPDKLRASFWIIPEVGSFIGWKKLRDSVLAKVQIPDRAKRTCSLQGRKCRAEYVKTLALYRDGKPFKGVGISNHSSTCKYQVGKITRPDSYDDSRFVECSTGIHFFITRQEAEEY